MVSVTTGVALLRWPLVSAFLMFLASTLNIKLRKSDLVGLSVLTSLAGLAAACWFATGLLGITVVELAAVWNNIKDVMVQVVQQTPPNWPMVIT